jgi:hypothetical protein
MRGSSPADSVGRLAESFAGASEAAGGVAAEEYLLSDARVSLRFASPALHERLAPAFAHLVADTSERGEAPSLVVHLWDSASTRSAPPPRPPTRANEPAGALYHFHEPPVRIAYQPGLETLSVLDVQTGIAWYWTANAFEQASWDRACPIRQILFWWLASRRYLQVHAAAVGTPEGGALLVGQPGSGKSTVALACLRSDLLYAGDDYVAVTLEPSPRLASLYSSGKLDPSHVRRVLPQLLPLLANPDPPEGEKGVLYVQEHFPEQTTAGFPLAALVIPTVRKGRREPQLVAASRAEAFAALGPSTMFQLHTAGSSELAMLSGLVARLPCYRLELGGDVSALPATISELLSRH